MVAERGKALPGRLVLVNDGTLCQWDDREECQAVSKQPLSREAFLGGVRKGVGKVWSGQNYDGVGGQRKDWA